MRAYRVLSKWHNVYCGTTELQLTDEGLEIPDAEVILAAECGVVRWIHTTGYSAPGGVPVEVVYDDAIYYGEQYDTVNIQTSSWGPHDNSFYHTEPTFVIIINTASRREL